MTWFSIHSRVAILIGCAMSWNVPSLRLRLGMAMNNPDAPSMTFNPRMTKAFSNVMLANPLSLLSSRKVILISEISKMSPSPLRDWSRYTVGPRPGCAVQMGQNNHHEGRSGSPVCQFNTGRMGPDDLDVQTRFSKLRDNLRQVLTLGKNRKGR